MRLLLARHGESLWNGARRFQGRTDVGLSDLGRLQARALRRALRGYRVTAAYASPLCRARETAEIALEGRGVEIATLPERVELSLGEWERCSMDEVGRRAGDPLGGWVRAPLDCPPPGRESLRDVARRVGRAIARSEAVHPNGEDVLVVAHGGVISVYASELLRCSLNETGHLVAEAEGAAGSALAVARARSPVRVDRAGAGETPWLGTPVAPGVSPAPAGPDARRGAGAP